MAHSGVAAPLPTPAKVAPSLRRFELPDFSSHGRWMGQRLLAAYPHLNEQQVFGWLNQLVFQPEFSFLWQNNSCALAQSVRSFSLAPAPVIQEHFVFVRERENPDHLEEAAEFYAEFARWGQHQGADTILLGHASDVPEEVIRKRLGPKARVLQTQQVVIKLGKDPAAVPRT